MRIAVPIQNGRLSPHFGQSEAFAILEADLQARTLTGCREVAAPQQGHSALPMWLQQHGVQLVIAGGIGDHALARLAGLGIEVLSGAAPEAPTLLVHCWLNGSLAINRSSSCKCNHHSHA